MTSSTLVEHRESTLTSIAYAILIVAIGLFISSLFFPVFITQTHDIQGYWVLAMGWLGFINFQFAWYATPFTILAIYVSKTSPQSGLFLSIIAIIIASEAFLFTEVPFGKSDKVLDYSLGFYLWYLCFYLVSFSILLNLVAWGSVEEDNKVIPTRNSEHAVTTDTIENIDEGGNPTFPAITLAKVTRKIIPKRIIESVATNDAHRYANVATSQPPKLPRKNLYADKDIQGKVPPPLPVNKWFVKPPPLPRWKQAIKPPPLPTRKLAIAPFLNYK